MPVYLLDERLAFPPPEEAPRMGPLAVGGDLRPERLVLAYSLGIFPWYSANEPIQWHSPDPRMVLLADELRVTRSLRRTVRKERFRVSLDTAFAAVVEACAETPRPEQDGTWITDEMKAAYVELHERGARALGRGMGWRRAGGGALRRLPGGGVLRGVDVRPPGRRIQGGVRHLHRAARAVGGSSDRLPGVHGAPGPLRGRRVASGGVPQGASGGARAADASGGVAV